MERMISPLPASDRFIRVPPCLRFREANDVPVIAKGNTTGFHAPASGGGTLFRSVNIHFRRGGVTRVVTITMITTAE